MLKYNTLYQSLKKVSAEWHAGHVEWSYSWYYFKFFSDNTFIYASINGDDFNQINEWFNKKAENVTRGTFEEKNYQVSLNFDDVTKISAGFTNEGKLLVQGKLSWEMFSPVD
jgi:hypothetical protein